MLKGVKVKNSSTLDAINTFRKMSVIQHLRDLVQHHQRQVSLLEKRLTSVASRFNSKASESNNTLYLVDCVSQEWQRKASEYRCNIDRKMMRLSEEKATLNALIEKRKSQRVIQFTKQKEKLKVSIQSLSASIDSIRLKLNQPKKVAINDIKKVYKRYINHENCLNQTKAILDDYCENGLNNIKVREYVLKQFKDSLAYLASLQSTMSIQQQLQVVKVVTLLYVLQTSEESGQCLDRHWIQFVFRNGRWPALNELGLNLTSLVECLTQPRALYRQVGLNLADSKIKNLFKISPCSSKLLVTQYLMFFEEADRTLFLNAAVKRKGEIEFKQRMRSYFSFISFKEALSFYAATISNVPFSLLFFNIAAIIKGKKKLINGSPELFAINIVLWTATIMNAKAWNTRQIKYCPDSNMTFLILMILWTLTTVDLTQSFSTIWLLSVLLGSELFKAAYFVSWIKRESENDQCIYKVVDGQIVNANHKTISYLIESEGESHRASSYTWKTF